MDVNVRSVSPEVWHRFRVAAVMRQLRMADAIAEAVNDWVDKVQPPDELRDASDGREVAA